jgi:septal ring factor EnvC (AmiA/AmiB activator)
MNASSRRSGVDFRIVLIGVLVLLLAFGGAAVWAYTTNTDLEKTRQTLSTTSSELDTTKKSLADTEAKLATAKSEVETEQETIENDKTRIGVLQVQIDQKGACIAAQTDNLGEIRRILALERENFNRTTSGSVWAKSNDASNKALDLAISYLKSAYTSAAAGKYNTANSWLSKSNAQVAISNKQIKTGNAEIDAMNAASTAINKANDDFAVTLDKTTATCGG